LGEPRLLALLLRHLGGVLGHERSQLLQRLLRALGRDLDERLRRGPADLAGLDQAELCRPLRPERRGDLHGPLCALGGALGHDRRQLREADLLALGLNAFRRALGGLRRALLAELLHALRYRVGYDLRDLALAPLLHADERLLEPKDGLLKPDPGLLEPEHGLLQA